MRVFRHELEFLCEFVIHSLICEMFQGNVKKISKIHIYSIIEYLENEK